MTTVCMYTQSGEAHGLINTLTNSVEHNDFKHMTPAAKAKIEKEKKEDSRMVKVQCLCSKGKHERLVKPYCRYAGDPIQQYNLIPDYVYEVPYGFVKEVNAIRMPKRSGLVSLDGKDLKRDGSPLDQDQEGEWIFKLVPAGF